MALPTTYRVGAVTVSANGTAVTGAGTNWIAGGIREGDIFAARGLTATIESVDSATSLTLSEPWSGAALSNAEYEIRYTPDASRVLAASKAALVAIEETYEGSRAAIEEAQLRKNNLTASRAPVPSDNEAQGYAAGSRWLHAAYEWLHAGGGKWEPIQKGELPKTLLDGTYIPPTLQEIKTSGYYKAGDGGAATYVRGLTVPVTKDPTFMLPSAWTAGSRWTVAGDGKARAVAGSGSASGIDQTVRLVPGREYRAEFTISARTAGGVRFRLLGGSTSIQTFPTRTEVGDYVETFVAPAGVDTLRLVVADADTALEVSRFVVLPTEPDTEYVGPNMFDGGAFAFAGAWVSNRDWVFDTAAGRASVTGAAANALFRTPDLTRLRLIAGQTYEVECSIEGYQAGAVRWRGYTLDGRLLEIQNGPAWAANGNHVARFTALEGIDAVGFYTEGASTTLSLKNVRISHVRPITRSHIISSDGTRWVLSNPKEIWIEQLGGVEGRDCTDAIQEALAVQQIQGGTVRAGYGVFPTGPVHMYGQVNFVGSGLDGLGVGGRGPLIDHGTIFAFTPRRNGDFFMSRYGSTVERDWFSRFKVLGSGPETGLMDGGFRFPVSHVYSNSPQFHEVGWENINGWGIWIPYSIRLAVQNGYFRSCGQRGNPASGGGIYMLTAAAHTGKTLAAISGQLNPLDLIACNYGFRVADGDVATIMTTKEVIAQYNTYAIYAPNSTRWRVADCYFELNQQPSSIGWGSEQGNRKHDNGAGGGDIIWTMPEHVFNADFERGVTRLKARSGALQINAPADALSANGAALFAGTDDPNGVVTALQSSIYLRRTTDSGTPRLYVKYSSGSANSSWYPMQAITSGPTSSRPTGVPRGFVYYDTTLGRPVWWHGPEWKDATGTTA